MNQISQAMARPTLLGNSHESLLRGYNILEVVKAMLKDGCGPASVLMVIEHMEGGPIQQIRAELREIMDMTRWKDGHITFNRNVPNERTIITEEAEKYPMLMLMLEPERQLDARPRVAQLAGNRPTKQATD